MHQGQFIKDYLQKRKYALDEVSELTGIPENRLKEVYTMEVAPSDVVEKIAFHIASCPPGDFFGLPGDGQPFG